MRDYTPSDRLFLWWLGDPAQPECVGELNLVRSTRGVSLRYGEHWLAHGFALSEDLPLLAQEFLPAERESAAGAVDDARPDRWGERVIRFVDRPPRLSLLEYLYFAGDDRFGALGVSTSAQAYLPRRLGPLPTLADAQTLQHLVQMVLDNEPVPEAQRRLISPGGTLGGARPKALIEVDGRQWVVKFSEGEPADVPLIEHASMTLAAQAGIRVSRTRPIRLADGHAVAIERFDRVDGRRRHALTAHVVLRAAGERYGYPELAQLLRRRGIAARGTNAAQMQELFRRMVFNILLDNTDDHEKNHAVVVNAAQEYALSPVYDVLPSGQALGFQQIRVGERDADATLDNALSMARLFALDDKRALAEARRVAAVVARWKEHFAGCGVRKGDIELYAEQIDRPFLRGPRESLAPRVRLPRAARPAARAPAGGAAAGAAVQSKPDKASKRAAPSKLTRASKRAMVRRARRQPG